LLVDVSMMDSVEVAENRVRVGAGVRLAGLVAALAAHGRALPTGTCPTVGAAGLTLGGGWGILGRRYGLTCDHLTRAEVVTADGDVLVVDDEREPDLFWALRGGGTAGLAMVTSMVFRTVPAPRMTSFRCRWPAAAASAVTNAWLAWAVDAPDRMCAELGVSADAVTLHGAMAANGAETAALVDRFRRDLPPARTDTVELSYLETARYHAERLGELDPAVHLYSTSEFFERDLPGDTVDALLARFATGPAVREIGFMPWGGAYGAVPAADTAFAHRRARYLIHHIACTDEASDPADAWVRDMRDVVHGYGTGGVFANFADAGLDDPERAYYGDNAGRLRDVKGRYDPGNLFGPAVAAGP
jgi:FAD/FMN-containing dehydrogenase